MVLPRVDRADAVDVVASTLLTHASRLTRVLLRPGTRELSRTEAGLLATLSDGPRRVTELAKTEALAQPTVTQLVDRLERRGLVTRRRATDDRRVVLVAVSQEGRARLHAVQSQLRAEMRDVLGDLSDDDLNHLVAATETLGRLVESLQQRPRPTQRGTAG